MLEEEGYNFHFRGFNKDLIQIAYLVRCRLDEILYKEFKFLTLVNRFQNNSSKCRQKNTIASLDYIWLDKYLLLKLQCF